MIDTQPHIVLVEPEQLLQEITAFRLELLGFRVTVLSTAAETIKFISESESNPELLVIDVDLEDASGIDVVTKLSTDQRTSTMPVMVMAFNSDVELVERAFAAGAKEFVVLPFDPAVLEQKVEALIEMAPART